MFCKRNGARILALGVTVALLVTATSACAPTPTPTPLAEKPKPEVYKIGFIEDFTGPGAFWGYSHLKGATIALEEINAAGGINGVPIELVVEDNRYQAADTITAFKKLAEVDKVPCIAGFPGSTLCFAVCPETAKYKVVGLTCTASNPNLGAQCPDYFFRLGPSDKATAPVWVDMLEHLHEKGVTDKLEASVMYINNDYGIGLKDAFVEDMEKRGYKVIHVQPFTEAAQDFRTGIMKVAETEPKVTFLGGYLKEQGLILKQATELGFETQWVTDACAVAKEVCDIAGEAAEGVIAPYPGSKASPEWKEYTARFGKRYGEAPTAWSEFSYDAIKVLAMAIEKGGYDGTGIRDALRDVANDYVGPSGAKEFMPGDNVVRGTFDWMTVKEGEWVIYER